MFNYLIQRIFYFIPTFFVISLIIFFLSKVAGDALNCYNNPMGIDIEQCKEEARIKGYDKPIFYISYTTAAHPDTLHKIFREERRNMLSKLIEQYGNWDQIQTYYQALLTLDQGIEQISINKNKNLSNLQKATDLLFVKYKDKSIQIQLDRIKKAASDSLLQALNAPAFALEKAYNSIKKEASPHKIWIPSLRWQGFDNQYHFWMSNFLKGNFGISNRDQNPVFNKIRDRLPWTLYINIPAIFFAYLLSIPLGIYAAVYKNSKFDRISSNLLLLFYSLPAFWIATLLVNFLTTPEFGMKIFPSIGLAGNTLNSENITRLLLPVFCVTYSSLAFMTRQMRSSMIATLEQDYIRTARAKGLTEQKVIWKHAFRNSLFPLITIFGAVLPAAFAGSVIIEYIFNINGMGWLMLDSIRAHDWPVVYAILMIAAILTMLGILVADILYAVVDPRVQLDKK